jgi:hypothetical protein
MMHITVNERQVTLMTIVTLFLSLDDIAVFSKTLHVIAYCGKAEKDEGGF